LLYHHTVFAVHTRACTLSSSRIFGQERTFTINAYNQHGERLLQKGPDPLGRAVKDTQADLAASLASSSSQPLQPPLVLGVESDVLRSAREASVRASATDLPELRAPQPPHTIALPGLAASAHCHTGTHQKEEGQEVKEEEDEEGNGKDAASVAWHYAPTMCHASPAASRTTALKANTLSGGLVVQPAPPPGTGVAALKSFRKALDATNGSSGGKDSARALMQSGGEKATCLVEARKKAQRCHELLRHFYVLTTAAQGAWRAAKGNNGEIAPAGKYLAPADAAKLTKLEARMEVVVDEVRKETRTRAEEAIELQQRGAHVAHAQCLQAMAQLRALEKQFEKAFSTLSALRGEDTGSGLGGFVAIPDSPRKGARR